MKIKVINPNTTLTMTAKIGEAASAVAFSETQVVAVSPSMGPVSVEGHYDEAVSALGVVDEVRKGAAEGMQGAIAAAEELLRTTPNSELAPPSIVAGGPSGFRLTLMGMVHVEAAGSLTGSTSTARESAGLISSISSLTCSRWSPFTITYSVVSRPRLRSKTPHRTTPDSVW